MKKICFVVNHPNYAIGGAEIHSYRLSKYLYKKGYDVCYLNAVFEKDDFKEEELIEGIRIYNYIPRKKFRILNFFTIKKLLSEIHADVYYLRASPLQGIIVFLTKKGKAKTIWQCASGRSLIKFIRTKELIKSKKYISILANLFDTLCDDFLRMYAIKNSTIVIAQTRLNKLYLRNYFKRKSYLIKKGIPIAPKDVKKDNTKTNILHLRNIKRHTRIKYFIEVARRLENEGDFEFKVIGRVSSEKKDVLISFKENNIHYLGEMDHDSVLKELEKTHILIDTLEEFDSSTVYQNVFLEAWLHKVIAISYYSNPDDVFEKHNVGFLVESVDDCVEKIKYLSSNRKIMSDMGSEAYEYVSKNHNINKEVGELINLIENK